MSLSSRAFRGSNHHQMGSNYLTDINQGGGSKKAGLLPSIGNDSWTSIYYGNNGLGSSANACRSLSCMQFTVNPGVKQSRPVSSVYVPNTYFKLP